MKSIVFALIAAFSLVVMGGSPSMAGSDKGSGKKIVGSSQSGDFSGKASGSGR